jgi:hypothetical protein
MCGDVCPGELLIGEKDVSEDIGVGYDDTPLFRPDENAGNKADKPGKRIPSLLSSGSGVACCELV